MKMKKNLLMAVGSLALGAALVGGATFSEFSSSGTSTGNTFTAGTMNIDLNGNGGTTSGTWVSPANWAPGQSVTSVLKISNAGNVDAHHIYFGFKDVTHSGGTNNANLLDKIIVKDIHESFNGHVTGNAAAAIDQQVGGGDGKLTLKEFSDFIQGGYGYYTADDQSGDGIVLAGGNQHDYEISMTFQFDPNADNDYQGTQAGFTLMANATQNSPTAGLVALHPEK